jgi:hypothetical protein
MAITSYTVQTDPNNSWNRIRTNPVVSHEGCVIGTFSVEQRVMSDIYADVTFATVWDPETKTTKVVRLYSNFELDMACAVAVVDLKAEYLADYEACVAAGEAAKLAAEKARVEAALARAAKEPVRGRTCKVVKGRKVPVGTVGFLFWTGAGTYGARGGLKLDDGSVVWTALNNLEAVAA